MTDKKEQYVTLARIHHNKKLYPIGKVIELTEDEALPLLKVELIAQGVKGIATTLNETNALKKAFEDGLKEGIAKAAGQITDELLSQIAMDDELFDKVVTLHEQIDTTDDLSPEPPAKQTKVEDDKTSAEPVKTVAQKATSKVGKK